MDHSDLSDLNIAYTILFGVLYYAKSIQYQTQEIPCVLRHTQGAPTGFWNGVDWRALVRDHNFMAAAESAVVLLELDDQWD